MTSSTLTVGYHALPPAYQMEVSDPDPGCVELDRGNEEIPGPNDMLLDDVPSSSGSAAHVAVDRDDENFIMSRNFIVLRSCQGLLTTVTLKVSDSSTKQDQGNKATAGPGDQLPQDVPSSSGSATHTDENEEMVITSGRFIFLQIVKVANDEAGIQATDVALGLRRIPAGFYTVVHHGGGEWRTENKCSSVNNDIVEWNGLIPL